MHPSYSIPLYLNGNTHISPGLGPDVVLQPARWTFLKKKYLEGGTKNRAREMGGTTVSEKSGESDKGGVRGKGEVAVEEEEKSSKHTVSCD